MTSENLKISVVTVCYNAVETIEETMLSVLNQTYPNIEYIIIDGGSTDGTVDIIKKYADRLAYWISEPDRGIYDAMNKGIDVATGDFIYFLGSDDVFFNSDVLVIVISHLKNNKNIIYGDVRMKNRGNNYDGEFNTYKLCKKNISHQAIFYPRYIYTTNYYDTKFYFWADYKYNMELYSKYHHRFQHINTVIAIFNDLGRGSKNEDKVFMSNRLYLIRTYFGNLMFIIMYLRFKFSALRKWILKFFLHNSL